MQSGPRRLLAIFALLTALTSHTAMAQQAEVTSLSIRALRVSDDGSLKLFTSFRAADNQPISDPDLAPLHMELDGEIRTLEVTATDLEQSGQGLGVLIAIDVSGSMKKAMPEIRRHLAWYAHQLDPSLDQAAVGTIGNEWSLILPFTSDMDLVAATIEEIDARTKTTALFESVYEGVDLLKRQGTSFPARRLMIVITDGQNEKSGRTVSDCVQHANASHVQVHALIFLTSQRETYLEAIGETEKLSRDTGGEVHKTDSPDEIQQAVEALRSDLLAEVVLTIPGSSLVNDGKEHELILVYGGTSDRINYRSPLPGVEPPTEEVSADTGSPISPTLVAGVVVAVVCLLGLLVVIIVLTRRRKRVASSWELDQDLEIEAELPPPPPPEPEQSQQRSMNAPDMEPEPGPGPEPEPPPIVDPVAVEQPDPPVGDPPLAADKPPKKADTPRKERKTVFRPPPTGAPRVTRFRVISGCEAMMDMEIPAQGASIGADPGNHIVIIAPSVSSVHAEVVPAAAGMAIRDMGSTNGTFVNTVRVGDNEMVMLEPGCQVQLGLVVLEFLE